MIYSLVFAAVALGPGIGASPLMATPPMTARDLNFGTCTNPCVSFSSGAFVPENLVDFPHAGVSEPGIIFPFICSQLVSKCGLHETDPAVLACLKGAPPAEALGPKGIAADTFNAALGFTTDFSAVDKSGPSTGSHAGSPAGSPRDQLAHVPPPQKPAPPPAPSPSLVRPPPVPRNGDSHIPKPVPSPPHAPAPPHRHHPVSGPHSRALRDVDVGTHGPAPDKDEGQNGVKGGAPPAKGQDGGPPPSSSLPPPQSPPPAHGPSPVPVPGLL